jgi:hypothetical protein
MTFTQSLNAFADHVLNTALGTVDAGACHASWGQECACTDITGHFCATQHRWTQWQYSCSGVCKMNLNACC